jgi:hypothetical protein
MPLYTCRFCDHTTKLKPNHYNHLNKHINEHADSIEPEELELCKFYRNKRAGYMKEYLKEYLKEYYQNNKEFILQQKKEYYQNNKNKWKEYRLRKKLEKQQAEDIDELIIDCD